jgi:hypothetical protein
MPHPNGGQGNTFPMNHTFDEAFAFVGTGGWQFSSTTGEAISARLALADDCVTEIISFHGERSYHGNVCSACWGFRMNCSGKRIGQCVEALDAVIP